MTRTEQIVEILSNWRDIVAKEYEDYTYDEQRNHLLDEGFHMDELIEACKMMEG